MSKNKLVIHISMTSLAGAPIRIVNALNKYSDFSARLVDFLPLVNNNGYLYPEDLNWKIIEERNIAIELIKNADIIHFHHYMDLRMNPFILNFNTVTKPNCKFIKQFHSSKSFIQHNTIRFDEYYSKDSCPKIVIPHYPERTFLDFDIVPNIIPINEEYCKPKQVNNDKLKIVFSASNKNPITLDRWATKGYWEVSPILKRLSQELDFEYIEINGLNFFDAMNIKQNADIIIGDVVTGSYHLTELEGLSLGKPTLSYLDGRSVMTFLKTFNTEDIPFVNVSINELENALRRLISDESLRNNLGKFSRKWMEKYYREELLIKKLCEIYDKLLKNEPIYRENTQKDRQVKEFLYNEVYDYRWENIKE